MHPGTKRSAFGTRLGKRLLPGDKPVFAVVVNGEAVAFPRHDGNPRDGQHNRRGTPPRQPILHPLRLCAGVFYRRGTRIGARANKMMYEFQIRSMIDTFTGQAVSGPLWEAGVRLQQTTVIASGWGEWKEANPHTYIVVEDGGLGRSYPEDPLRGRDDQGPIFPIGNADDALPVHEKVLGVVRQDASNPIAVAFPVVTARRILDGGGSVRHEGITVIRDGGGLRAVGIGPDGQEIPSHEAFWFAWSQFYPDTVLWQPVGSGQSSEVSRARSTGPAEGAFRVPNPAGGGESEDTHKGGIGRDASAAIGLYEVTDRTSRAIAVGRCLLDGRCRPPRPHVYLYRSRKRCGTLLHAPSEAPPGRLAAVCRHGAGCPGEARGGTPRPQPRSWRGGDQ